MTPLIFKFHGKLNKVGSYGVTRIVTRLVPVFYESNLPIRIYLPDIAEDTSFGLGSLWP